MQEGDGAVDGPGDGWVRVVLDSQQAPKQACDTLRARTGSLVGEMLQEQGHPPSLTSQGSIKTQRNHCKIG